MASNLPRRKIDVVGKRKAPVVVYSDASFEPEFATPKFGWVLMPPGKTPQGRAGEMPTAAVDALKPRSTQIYPAEVFAVFACVWQHLDELRNQDVLFFIDNEAGCAALIRGSTTQDDVGSIVQATHWLLHSINARPWFEWVDSASNPSDGLSRDGLDDAWTRAQGWELDVAREPPWSGIEDHRRLALLTLG